MIKYKPTIPSENNVTSFKKNIFGHRLFLFLFMAGILIFSLWLICIPAFNSYVISHKKLFDGIFAKSFKAPAYQCYPSNIKAVARMQFVLDKLVASAPKKDDGDRILVCLTNTIPKPNAFASMGRRIAVTVKMLELVKTDEEMALILGHELGHIHNEDVYKKIGNIIFNNIVFMVTELITDSSFNLANMLLQVINFNDMHYSRKQEYLADAYGLELLMKNFKNYELGINFYKKAIKEGNDFGSMEIFYDHPDVQNRIDRLRKLATKLKDKNQIEN